MSLNQQDRPAPAQDEREAPVVVATAILGGIYHGGSGPELGEIDIEVCMPALEALQCETVNSSDDVFLPLMSVAQHERIVAALTRPAQTEQQPVGYQFQDREGVWKQFMSEQHYEDTLADGTWPIRAIYAAPIAQTAPLDVDTLAEIIRKVDGNHSLGAGVLAERIVAELATQGGIR